MFLKILSVAEHAKALNEEMKKPKPRDSVLLPLMKHTFHDRRIFVQNDASSVTEILSCSRTTSCGDTNYYTLLLMFWHHTYPYIQFVLLLVKH